MGSDYGIGLAYGVDMFFWSRREKFNLQCLQYQLRRGSFSAAVGGLLCTFAGLVCYPFLGTFVRRLIASRDASMANGSDNGSTVNQEELAVLEALQLLPKDYLVLTNLMLLDGDDNVDSDRPNGTVRHQNRKLFHRGDMSWRRMVGEWLKDSQLESTGQAQRRCYQGFSDAGLCRAAIPRPHGCSAAGFYQSERQARCQSTHCAGAATSRAC